MARTITSVRRGLDRRRSAFGYRVAQLLDDRVADLGGISRISAAKLSIIRRSCVMEAVLERLEASFRDELDAGRLPDREDLQFHRDEALAMSRLMATTGLDRAAKDITTISDFLPPSAKRIRRVS